MVSGTILISPCSVNVYGGARRAPPPLEVTNCDFKNSYSRGRDRVPQKNAPPRSNGVREHGRDDHRSTAGMPLRAHGMAA